MSNIDKQWLQQKIAEREAARDDIQFGLDEDDSNRLAALRIALASLEAEKGADPVAFINGAWTLVYYRPPKELGLKIGDKLYTAPQAPSNAEPVAWLWSHRKHPSEVTLVRPEDDEKAEAALWSGWSCQALYAAPPVPASVPVAWEWFYYKQWNVTNDPERAKDVADGGVEVFPLYRSATMLQGADGNSPDGWVACSDRLPETDGNYWGWWSESKRQGPVWFIKSELQAQFQSGEITHWMPLPAAPQQEVK